MTADEWFASVGWKPFAFQRKAWAAYAAGESGLIHASTGTGKTYAAFLGPVLETICEPPEKKKPPLRVLWISPLRALSADTAASLERPLGPLGLHWEVGVRTGDTKSSARARQAKRLPTVLVTTPESLSLLLTRADVAEKFAGLRCVVVDEWHELLGSKRGVLTELALARLRTFHPGLRTWGLSATLGNLDTALASLLGPGHSGRVIRGQLPKTVIIDAVIPPHIERFPWAGHLGLTLLPQVIDLIEEGRTALVFTNTRSQTEIWYQEILKARPQWAGQMALHHGSLDRGVRDWVEEQLRLGGLRCVVCTSSLDLGVDFAPVDRVVQIGSPKGVARLLQRAGRSGHQPGVVSRVTCVPTNALELIEIAAAREAALAGAIESREAVKQPLDLLAQHIISSALVGTITPAALFDEVRTTFAYRNLSATEWDWVMDFVTRGGDALRAYPEYSRVVVRDQMLTVPDARVSRRHRMAIGTISGDAVIEVRFLRGGRLGTVEESFAAKLKRGDRFAFAGRVLEFVRFHEMTVRVKLAKRPPNTVLRWTGGRLPLSSELAAAIRRQLDDARQGRFASPEMRAVRPLLEVQSRWSRLPGPNQLLVERLRTRQGSHAFFYPFEGRLVHEGMAVLLAYRLGKIRPQTFTLAVNDFGFELLSPDPFDLDTDLVRTLLDPASLADDVMESLNAAELAKRQFREVARIAGLITPGMPHAQKSARQLQASSSLFYAVFKEYDPGNLLLWQANREVLDRQFEYSRMRAALDRLQAGDILLADTPRPTPLAFPLLADRLRQTVSSETLADRVRKMVRDLERQADMA
ncbi:ligase-associated DNA damage response DEXH box helicase [Zavarzinella formosa]|uniref:ligase-associated DNA damage response DEXH box helicase n=1 Tax=Zavarzinella formosa TaxID=360055 RepID=UPI000318BE29|nr:ligase-associated DNA damage response DEXH box helicase [Zavarzinella formosa]